MIEPIVEEMGRQLPVMEQSRVVLRYPRKKMK